MGMNFQKSFWKRLKDQPLPWENHSLKVLIRDMFNTNNL